MSEGQLTPADFDALLKSIYEAKPQPEVEFVSPGEYLRRRKRHVESGVPMDIPSAMRWPL
jgi:hypothetical protein